MNFMSPRIRPFAWVAGIFNVAGFGAAAGAAEPAHAALHAGLAAAFGLWAWRIGRRAETPRLAGDQERLEELEAEMLEQRRELSEAQERLDFAERLLAQAAESRRVGAERGGPEA